MEITSFLTRDSRFLEDLIMEWMSLPKRSKRESAQQDEEFAGSRKHAAALTCDLWIGKARTFCAHATASASHGATQMRKRGAGSMVTPTVAGAKTAKKPTPKSKQAEDETEVEDEEGRKG
jgi:hypothetical protein